MPANEIVFQVWESPERGYEARAVGYSIFTQGDDWEDLKFMLRDAVLSPFASAAASAACTLSSATDWRRCLRS